MTWINQVSVYLCYTKSAKRINPTKFYYVLLNITVNYGIPFSVSGNENPINAESGLSGNVSNLAELTLRLKKMIQRDSEMNFNSVTFIGLTHAEVPRTLDPNVLPGIIRLSTILQNRTNCMVRSPVCIILMSRAPWSKWEMEAKLNSPPVTIKLQPYSRAQLSELMTQCLIATKNTESFSIDDNDSCKSEDEAFSDDLGEDFYRNFADVILGTFHAVAKSYPQLVSAARMALPAYLKPVLEKRIESDNSRALYRNVEPVLKKCLTTANLKESFGKTFEDQMKLVMQSYETHMMADIIPAEESRSYSRLSLELPFYSKFLLISAYIASYNPVKSDKRFFMKYHGKFKKRVQHCASVAAHKRSSQLLGPKQFPLDRMLAIFYVIVDVDEEKLRREGGAPTDIASQISSLVSLNLLTQVSTELDLPKYKCNVGLDFIRLLAKNVRFEVHKYLYDIQN